MKKFGLLLLAIMLSVSIFGSLYLVSDAQAVESICWDCGEIGSYYGCVGALDGYETCGMSSPDQCDMSGFGCYVN